PLPDSTVVGSWVDVWGGIAWVDSAGSSSEMDESSTPTHAMRLLDTRETRPKNEIHFVNIATLARSLEASAPRIDFAVVRFRASVSLRSVPFPHEHQQPACHRPPALFAAVFGGSQVSQRRNRCHLPQDRGCDRAVTVDVAVVRSWPIGAGPRARS